MVEETAIEDFLTQPVLAVAGVSRSGKKFGNRVYQDLKRKGYQVFPINPFTKEIDGERCYPDLEHLPQPVGGVVAVIPPEETERLVQEMARLGISRLWMQPGAESAKVMVLCREKGISAVAGECVMQYPGMLSRFNDPAASG